LNNKLVYVIRSVFTLGVIVEILEGLHHQQTR